MFLVIRTCLSCLILILVTVLNQLPRLCSDASNPPVADFALTATGIGLCKCTLSIFVSVTLLFFATFSQNFIFTTLTELGNYMK